jgi:hypothetical protein
VAQALDLGVVGLVLARGVGVGKAAAGREIDPDDQPPLRRIEIDGLHEPWRRDAERCRKQLIDWTGHDIPPTR